MLLNNVSKIDQRYNIRFDFHHFWCFSFVPILLILTLWTNCFWFWQKVVQTRELLSKQAVQTREILSKQAVKIAKQAEEHERFINKVTHLVGVLGFGGFCFLLGARPQDIPLVYCFFYVIFVPLRWIYYRFKKWHYYLLVMSLLRIWN